MYDFANEWYVDVYLYLLMYSQGLTISIAGKPSSAEVKANGFYKINLMLKNILTAETAF